MVNHVSTRQIGACLAVTVAMGLALTPARAAEEESVKLAKCERPFGSIAMVDGDSQGWTAYGLSSPRELIAAMAAESGCFTIQNPGSGAPADYLMNIIAGDKEEVDRGTELAKTAIAEGLVRSGAAAQVFGRVPMGGALLGAFGGFGGKKKTIAAGIRMISPATGMTIVSGQGRAPSPRRPTPSVVHRPASLRRYRVRAMRAARTAGNWALPLSSPIIR